MNLRTRTLLYAAYLAIVSAWSFEVLRELYEFSRASSSASHLIVIPLVSFALIYQNRARVFADVSFAWSSGVIVVAATLVATAVAAGGRSGAPPLGHSVAELAALWVGGFLLFYGRKAVAEAVFPLGFLLLMIPASEAVLSWATRLLKAGSAEGVSTLFTLTGTPHYREGFVFTLSTIAIEIADECSGIRSSIALLLTALLIGHWWLRSFWAKTLLIAAVLPLAILKNAVRIASLSFLAVHMDPGFVTGGRLHNDGGIVFFLLALGLLSPIVAVLRRLENSVRKCDPPLRGVAPIEATETN